MRARTLEEYCHQANKLHGNKFQYLYLTTENGFRKIHLICPIHGDFWHGNPSIYQSEKINPKNGKTFGYLYNQTITRENRIKLHYNLQTIWENDWLRLMEINKI